MVHIKILIGVMGSILDNNCSEILDKDCYLLFILL